MPASKTTVDDVVRVLLKHLDAATLKKVVRDLRGWAFGQYVLGL